MKNRLRCVYSRYITARWGTIVRDLFLWLFYICFCLLHFLSYQKSSTRRSDPNLPNLPEIGVYDEVTKLSGLDINGLWKICVMSKIIQNNMPRFRIINKPLVLVIGTWYWYCGTLPTDRSPYGRLWEGASPQPQSTITHLTRINVDNFIFHKVLGKGSFGKVFQVSVIDLTFKTPLNLTAHCGFKKPNPRKESITVCVIQHQSVIWMWSIINTFATSGLNKTKVCFVSFDEVPLLSALLFHRFSWPSWRVVGSTLQWRLWRKMWFWWMTMWSAQWWRRESWL